MKKKTLLIAIAFLTLTSILAAQVTDKDGNNYKTVKIGKQIWMAENLNVSHFRNGDRIPEAENSRAWTKASKEGKPAWCYYNSNQVTGRTYHKLYNWYAVNDPRGLAPIGWHIPSTADWSKLTDYLGGKGAADIKMIAAKGWGNYGCGSNESGFSGLPGGFRFGYDGTFDSIGDSGYWSSSLGTGSGDVWYITLTCERGSMVRYGGLKDFKGSGVSVRCIKD